MNAAYERATRRERVQWVWLHRESDSLVITDDRPEAGLAIAVHPDGFALVVAEGAEVPWPEERYEPD